MDENAQEDWLQDHQDGRVYPLGRALRHTYNAENHDSLGSDVTGLMIDLSKVPYEPGEGQPIAVQTPPSPPPSASALRPSILSRLGGLFGLR